MSVGRAVDVEALATGERRALALVLTELERDSATCGPLCAALAPLLKGALVVGITGPPGAGKSTLVNALIVHYRTERKRVGVIAVDPSSPVSGGAILGDRVRMSAARDDDGAFVRSLASRGALGGISPAAVRMIDAFDAAGYDPILIETVGTGQSEIDIAEIADVRVVLAAPGLGDEMQAMKAGLLEIADILVVNKADRPGADQTIHQLQGALSLRESQVETVRVLKTVAATGDGVALLSTAIASIGVSRRAVPLVERRRRRARYLVSAVARDLVAARIRSGGNAALDAIADDVLAGRLGAADAARQLLAGGLT